MRTETPRPDRGAAAALAREPGSAADQIADALLELREARSRLRRVDSILAALLAEIGRHLPQNEQDPGNTPAARAPLNVHSQDNTDANSSRTAS